ncbi:hypothetical protein ACFL0D_02155 [Thermoproteota archaeon]
MIKAQVQVFEEFVQLHYSEKDSAHDFRHIQRIIKRLELLSKDITPINSSKLLFIACFHGQRDNIRNNEKFKKDVIEFLENQGWSDDEVEDGFKALFRHTRNPQSIEEKLVHDANNFGRLGAFGIAKAFTTGGARGQSIEETADIFEYQNLDKTVFLTSMGKKYGKEGIKYPKEFLKKLRSELK